MKVCGDNSVSAGSSICGVSTCGSAICDAAADDATCGFSCGHGALQQVLTG